MDPLLTVPAADRLGVLTTTLPVVARARHVRIVPERVEAVAAQIAAGGMAPPAWDATLHVRDGTWRTAGWVLALDALNFCFWSAPPNPEIRWRIAVGAAVYDGYWALAAALTRAVRAGKPLWDADYLANLSGDELAEILRPAPGSPGIPLFAERLANLRELGRGLRARDPGEAAAAHLVASAGGSAARLVQLVVREFPSFNDVATAAGQEVRFYKRAQILAGDLHGAFAGAGLGAFHDLDALTAFADYKVPQVLRRLGVLTYDATLAAQVDAMRLLPPGSAEEVEIRAATVWGCELIRRALAARGRALTAVEIDWALWTAGQALPPDARPYHRTLTRFY